MTVTQCEESGNERRETETIREGDKTVRLTHIDTHTELKLHSRGDELGQCSAPCWKLVVSSVNRGL